MRCKYYIKWWTNDTRTYINYINIIQVFSKALSINGYFRKKIFNLQFNIQTTNVDKQLLEKNPLYWSSHSFSDKVYIFILINPCTCVILRKLSSWGYYPDYTQKNGCCCALPKKFLQNDDYELLRPPIYFIKPLSLIKTLPTPLIHCLKPRQWLRRTTVSLP